MHQYGELANYTSSNSVKNKIVNNELIAVEQVLNYSLAELNQMCSHWHKYTIVELVVTDFRTDQLYIQVRKEIFYLQYFNFYFEGEKTIF